MSSSEFYLRTQTNNERLVLSGGVICPRFIDAMKEVSGMKMPHVIIDTSARKYSDKFKSIAKTYDDLLDNNGLPLPEYLQAESNSQSDASLHTMIDDADVLLVLGGSTQLIHDRWKQRGIAEHIVSRVGSGAMAAAGASAGTMIWFKDGYSDSIQQQVSPGSHWNYMQSNGLNILPYTVTAHHSDVDEHSRPRDIGFRDFLLRRSEAGECVDAIGFDTFAAIVAMGGSTRIINLAKDLKDPSHHDNDASVHVYTSKDKSLHHTPLYEN